MRFGTFAAAAALMLVPTAAMAQDTAAQAQNNVWRVLFGAKGVAVFVPDTIPSTGNPRSMTILVVLLQPAPNGSDIQYIDWVVDCPTLGLEMKDGRSFLGTRFISNTRPKPMAPTEENTLDRAIANYACTGATESGDTTRLNGDAEAVAYGKKISAE